MKKQIDVWEGVVYHIDDVEPHWEIGVDDIEDIDVAISKLRGKKVRVTIEVIE